MAAAERARARSQRAVLWRLRKPKTHVNVTAMTSAHMLHAEEFRDWPHQCQRARLRFSRLTRSDYLSEGIWRRGSGCLERHATRQRTQPSYRAVNTRVGPPRFLLRLLALVVKMLPGINNQTGLHRRGNTTPGQGASAKSLAHPPAHRPAPSSFAPRLATTARLHFVIAASQTRPRRLWAARRLPFRRAPWPRPCRVRRGESDRRTPRPERWRCSARAPGHPLAAP
jgi:hypothetical protein